MKPVNHAEKVVEIPLAHYSGNTSPSYQRMSQQVMNIPNGGGMEASGLLPARVVATNGA